MVGDAFTVSLEPTAGSGSLSASTSTYFDILNGNSTETSYTAYTSTPGTVTITPAAIPEPASIISGLTAFLILTGIHGAVRVRRSVARST